MRLKVTTSDVLALDLYLSRHFNLSLILLTESVFVVNPR
jgi:hypothetical protein